MTDFRLTWYFFEQRKTYFLLHRIMNHRIDLYPDKNTCKPRQEGTKHGHKRAIGHEAEHPETNLGTRTHNRASG